MFSDAQAYERYMGAWSRLLAPMFVRFFDVKDHDDAILDVGCGTGALTEAILDATKNARVTGIDPSRGYVEASKHPRAKFEIGSAMELPFGDASFDRAVSALVLNFVPEPARAVAEMKRVTKPGGVVAAAVWDYGEGMESLRVFWDACVALDSSAPDEKKMPLCRSGELGALWKSAGLDVEEAPIVVERSFESFLDWWAPFLLGQGPAGAFVRSLADERRIELEDRLRARLGEDPFVMKARAWAVKGTRP